MENHIEETSSKHDKGFTLVELLIVIVILGILATITVFAVRGITDKGTTSACAADKNTLAVAIESYFAQNGGTAIPTVSPATATVGATAAATLQLAGFLRNPISTRYTVGVDGSLVTAGAPCP